MSKIERVVVISEWSATYLLGLTALWAQASSQIVVLYPLSHVSCYQKAGYSFALLTFLTAGDGKGSVKCQVHSKGVFHTNLKY